jgi:hypothetical protein
MPRILCVWLTLIVLALSVTSANASLMSPDFKLEELEHGIKASTNPDYQRGYKAFDKGDVRDAIKWFRKAADAGDVKAQTNLGILYMFGWSLLKEGEEIANSNKLALKYFTMAADRGDPAAHHRIGYLYDPKITGANGFSDMDKAIEWFRKAAALGYVPAKEDLYGHFTSDWGFNLKEALKLTDWKAAYEGDAEAQYDLAILYWRASGSEGDLKENKFHTEYQITALKWIIVVQKNSDKALVKELLGDQPNMYDTILQDMKNPDIHKAVMLARACVDTKFKNCETPGPRPTDGTKAPATGDWHAIAGAFKKRDQAQARADKLGANWNVMNTSACPNFTNGYWIAATGGVSKKEARTHASKALKHKAYAKACH